MATEFNIVHSYVASVPANSRSMEINLYQTIQNRNQRFARLIFTEDNNIPDIQWDPNLIVVHYPIDRYVHVLDLLRNEKPITAYTNKEANRFGIRCGIEPVGEEESD